MSLLRQFAGACIALTALGLAGSGCELSYDTRDAVKATTAPVPAVLRASANPSAPSAAKKNITTLTFSGRLRVRIGEWAGHKRVFYSLTTTNGRRLPLRWNPPPGLRAGNLVEVTGEWAHDSLVVHSWHRVRERRRSRGDKSLIRTPTRHRVAVLAMQEAAVNRHDAFDFMGGRKMFRRYSIKHTDRSCQWNNLYDIADAMIDAFEQDGHDIVAYDHVAIVVPASCGSDWDGAWADVGSINDKGQTSFESLSMYKDDSFDPRRVRKLDRLVYTASR